MGGERGGIGEEGPCHDVRNGITAECLEGSKRSDRATMP